MYVCDKKELILIHLETVIYQIAICVLLVCIVWPMDYMNLQVIVILGIIAPAGQGTKYNLTMALTGVYVQLELIV